MRRYGADAARVLLGERAEAVGRGDARGGVAVLHGARERRDGDRGTALAEPGERLDQVAPHAGPHRLQRPAEDVRHLERIRRRQRGRRLQRRALDLRAGILERLVDQIEAVTLQVAVGARRLGARLDRRIVEHRLERLRRFVGTRGRDGAPDRGRRGTRGGRSLHLVARDLLGLGRRHQARVQRQRGGAKARRRLGPDRLLQRGPQGRRRRAGAPQDQQRRDARVIGRALVHDDAPEHGRRGGGRTGRDRFEQHQRRAPRARVAALKQVGQRGHDRGRLARRQRLRRLLGAAAQRRIRIAERERDDAGGVPGRQRRRLLKHGRAHVRRAIAQRRAQRRRVRRSSGTASSVPRIARRAAGLRFARLTARYGGGDRDAAAPHLGRHVGQRAREDLVLAGAAPANHGERRQDLAARRRIAERELQRRDAVRIAEQRLRDPARDRPQAVQHLAQPAGHAPGRRGVQRPRDAPAWRCARLSRG